MAEKGFRVLLVESSGPDREQYKGIIASECAELGVEILEAVKGGQALDICRTEPPDCLIIAEKLEDMEAVALLGELAGDSGEVLLPVVVVISRRSRQAVNQVMAAGARDWVSKDQASAVLGRIIRTMFERRDADLRLIEQRLLFRAMMMGAPGLLALKNLDLEYEAVNPAFCQLVGMGPEDIISRTDEALFAPEDAASLAREDRKVINSGVPQTDIQEAGPAGDRHWLEITRSPLTDASGETTGLLWFARDITDLKRMEDAVLEEKRLSETLALDQLEWSCRFGVDGVIAFVDDAMCRCLDRSREELMGQAFLVLLPEEDQENARRQISALNAQEPATVIDTGVVSSEGDIGLHRWTVRGLFGEDGGLIGYQAVGRDVTDLKRTEDALAQAQTRLLESEQRLEASAAELRQQSEAVAGHAAQLASAREEAQQLRAAVEVKEAELGAGLARLEQHFRDGLNLIPVPYCEVAPGGNLAFCNTAGMRLFGIGEDVIAGGVSLMNCFHGDDREPVAGVLRAVANGQAAVPGEYRVVRGDGATSVVTLLAAPVYQDDQVAGIRCCLLDMVDRERTAALLETLAQIGDVAARAAGLAGEAGALLAQRARLSANGEGGELNVAGGLTEVLDAIGRIEGEMRGALGG